MHIDLNGNSDQSYPVKVLDCDTISQVKRKCCLQIYRNKPVSEIPENNELILGKYMYNILKTVIMQCGWRLPIILLYKKGN